MRPVHEDERGQFMFDDDGKRVNGVWYIPRDECDTPIIVGDDFEDDPSSDDSPKSASAC